MPRENQSRLEPPDPGQQEVGDRLLALHGSVQLMFAIWRRAVAPVVRGAHNFLDWRGLAWPIEVRGLANRSEGLANRSEGLVAGLAGPCR